MEEKIMAIQKSISDLKEAHDERLRKLEVKNGAGEEMLKTLFNVIDELKESMKKIEKCLHDGFGSLEAKVAEKYVTKDQLALIEKDGKYKQIFGALVGSMITFVVLSGLGIIISKLG